MILEIPGEPVGKGRPRVVRNGAFSRTYTPEKTASYENLVKITYDSRYHNMIFPADAHLSMTIRANYGIPKSASARKRKAMIDGEIRPTKKPDCDNVGKIIADALNGMCYHDDAQIVEMRIEKWYSNRPCVIVEVKEL